MSTNFHLAPPTKMVDGLLAVPIDIQSIDATFEFDGANQPASAEATITYTVGPTAGNPIFDLRQTITQAWLDNAPFDEAKLAHHEFDTGPCTELRVIESVQQAGSVHQLRVQYTLALLNFEMGGYLPVLKWSRGRKLDFRFGLSDLRNARYMEAWLPANLPFDQFSLTLKIRIINTSAKHRVITNGTVTNHRERNHWRISFPAHSTSCSPLLEIRPRDSVEPMTDTVVLPVSGKTVAIDAWKETSVNEDLAAQINKIKKHLKVNEKDYGPYVHDERFVALFVGGGIGMEYDGGTTTPTSDDVLNHEIFHSWFARGVKPATHADGWWDEGFAKFHDDGANGTRPLNFSDPPVELCSRNPWQRSAPSSFVRGEDHPDAYRDGDAVWQRVASLLGVANLNALMRDLYETYRLQPVTTEMIEEFLLCRSGNARIVDVFHRYVYGLDNPRAVDLWLKNHRGHVGEERWRGNVSNSPDLWIRNQDDRGTRHQSPKHGQDNWFCARVRNKAGTRKAKHFVVTFNAKSSAGTKFVYPDDFLPCVAAKAGFDLPPGKTKIVTARWPRQHVPPPGTPTCLLASIITRKDHPKKGRRVGQHNNLARKNLT